MSDTRGLGRVAPWAAPARAAEWDPLVPSAARRAAFGRVGDGADGAGAARGARTRPTLAGSLMNVPG
jgi:hypothetical protein